MIKFKSFMGNAALVGLILISPMVMADKLVYRPVNPSFGGDPSNGSTLLSEANAQNPYKDPSSSSNQTFQEKLQAAVQQAIINKISNGISTDGLFDSNGNLVLGKKVCVTGTTTCITVNVGADGTPSIDVSSP